jgi:hypothetical protein
MTEIVAASALQRVRYSYRAAHEANAIHQFQLVGPSKLGREARDRDLGCSAFESTLVKQLEQLDREGAFSPVLFEMVDESGNDAAVFRDEVEYRVGFANSRRHRESAALAARIGVAEAGGRS